MENSNLVAKPAAELFWSRYLEVLKLFRISEQCWPWYRRHVEAFIDFTPGIRLIERDAEHVERWLNHSGRNADFSDWQFRQRVDALRLLYCHFVKLTWAASFDWDYWASGATRLEASHATVTRTYELIDQAVEQQDNHLARLSPEIYRKFLVAIRIPEYAANTEKSYLGWINRFLRFHQGVLPCDLAEAEVASFLEHLALKRKVAGATQSQALNALVFLFARVLQQPLGQIGCYRR